MEPMPMEEVERTDTLIVRPQQRVGVIQRSPYAIDIDRRRNCYACGEFEHMAQHYRNRGTVNRIGEGRRLEYGSRKKNGQRRITREENKQQDNTSDCDLNNKEALREVMVKIRLERVDTQEGITVEMLLDNSATGLVMSSEFARKQWFKLKKIERSIYVRNMDSSFNKEGPIKYTVEVNIYYQEH